MRAILLSLLLAASAPAAEPSREALATIVLYNRNDADSRALAKYYAEKRDIPFRQVLGLNCSAEEEITRDHYLVAIEAPLRSAFTKNNWWTIDTQSGRRVVTNSDKRFVAVMRGVPLKIKRDPALPGLAYDVPKNSLLAKLEDHNEASVDSELAALFALDERPASVLANPYFRSFKRIFDVPAGSAPLLVCRLDGPSDAIVRGMIDASLETERTGLWGWAYLDARNIRSGPYKEGDDWILKAGDVMRRQGIPVILDLQSRLFPAGYPVTDASIYYGWYTDTVAGPFADPRFRFVPGAIAVHLHSYSAITIRSAEKAWVGPLLARGAAATMGNVYEPYLALTVDFAVMQDRLINGFTLAESGYAAYRGLSWMGIIVGDPLYRPYANWGDLTAPEAHNPWHTYRKTVLAAGGDPLAAAEQLHKLAAESGNSMFLEALGQAQAAVQQFDEALATLDDALKIEKSTDIRFRLNLEKIQILQLAKESGRAREAISDALGEFRTEAQQAVLGRLVLDLKPTPEE